MIAEGLGPGKAHALGNGSKMSMLTARSEPTKRKPKSPRHGAGNILHAAKSANPLGQGGTSTMPSAGLPTSLQQALYNSKLVHESVRLLDAALAKNKDSQTITISRREALVCHRALSVLLDPKVDDVKQRVDSLADDVKQYLLHEFADDAPTVSRMESARSLRSVGSGRFSLVSAQSTPIERSKSPLGRSSVDNITRKSSFPATPLRTQLVDGFQQQVDALHVERTRAFSSNDMDFVSSGIASKVYISDEEENLSDEDEMQEEQDQDDFDDAWASSSLRQDANDANTRNCLLQAAARELDGHVDRLVDEEECGTGEDDGDESNHPDDGETKININHSNGEINGNMGANEGKSFTGKNESAAAGAGDAEKQGSPDRRNGIEGNKHETLAESVKVLHLQSPEKLPPPTGSSEVVESPSPAVRILHHRSGSLAPMQYFDLDKTIHVATAAAANASAIFGPSETNPETPPSKASRKSKTPSTSRMLPSSSSSGKNTSATRPGMESPTHVEDSEVSQLEGMLHKIDQWDEFNIFVVSQLAPCGPLVAVGFAIFERHGFFQNLHIPEREALRYLSLLQSRYLPNPYHNAIHGADVAQTLNHFFVSCGLSKYASNEIRFASVFAALGHDVAHPGVTNSYLVQTWHPLAIRYNDRSPLEMMHASVMFELLQAPGANLLRAFPQENLVLLRKIIVSMVLATENAEHDACISRLTKVSQTLQSSHADQGMMVSDLEQIHILEASLHAADISASGKTWPTYQQWTERLCIEFRNQGDLEKERGLPVLPFMDRSIKLPLARFQSGFIEAIVLPLYEALNQVPDICLDHAVSNIKANLCRWGHYTGGTSDQTATNTQERGVARAARTFLLQRSRSHGYSSGSSMRAAAKASGSDDDNNNEDENHHRQDGDADARLSAAVERRRPMLRGLSMGSIASGLSAFESGPAESVEIGCAGDSAMLASSGIPRYFHRFMEIDRHPHEVDCEAAFPLENSQSSQEPHAAPSTPDAA
ncbi:cAMP-specific 3',5'-cyclic phosphodiesterase [Hondaea fermentalgiana]|uniref:Phosphodiesterase n=1 Tax=Hondaea fermentalgiana TaxID=2315210 RepID=A0A2R5FYT8_9STRA|nr:cAMP-specific 3',5'-cyclic phosphodiesterase [Hondaea fermentalgiana]|eukprot:GBG23917.1 cAMP-specific 3',5'-cyclic phosphodiesterase [Hondaea fermentalgiana]